MTPASQDLSVMDKSPYIPILTATLFENLTNAQPFDSIIVAEIVRIVAQFTDSGITPQNKRSTNAVYRFCASPGLLSGTVPLALQIARIDLQSLYAIEPSINNTQDVTWAYAALETIYDSIAPTPEIFNTIGDLLQVLYLCGHQGWPTKTCVHTILWPFSLTIDSSDVRRMKYLAFHILCSADHWFRDGGELQVVLQENSVWKKLGIFSRGTGTTGTWSKSPAVHMYIKLGDKICDLPPWNSIIGQDLPGWLGCLSSLRGRQEDDTKFQSVLSRVWQENQEEANKFKNEQRFAMSFNALAHVWDRCDFSNHEMISCLFSLVQCTVSTVLCTKIIPITGSNKLGKPSKSFKDIIVAHLENSLSQAIQKMKISTNLIPDDQSLTGILHGSAEVLSELVLLINEELRDSDRSGYGWDDQAEQQYWRDLEARFNTDLEVLKDVFTTVKTSSRTNTPLEANTPHPPQAPPPRS